MPSIIVPPMMIIIGIDETEMYMKILVVGAGATGGYIGAKLVRAGRDVMFLVHPATRERLERSGIQMRLANATTTSVSVRAVTAETLNQVYDVAILAVRNDAVPAAIDDFAGAIGAASTVVSVVNGVAHLNLLTARFGTHRVCGGSAQLVTSLDSGVVQEVKPGAAIQIGRVDSGPVGRLAEVAAAMTVEDVSTTVSDDIVAVMWRKFAFITATAALTCLLRSTIGPIARTAGGPAIADALLDEIFAVMNAKGHGIDEHSRTALHDTLTDPTSTFGPSMFRDLAAGRRVEAAVLGELTALARDAGLPTPLLEAALVGIQLHNTGI